MGVRRCTAVVTVIIALVSACGDHTTCPPAGATTGADGGSTPLGDGGAVQCSAVVDITGVSQSAVTVTEGGSVSLSITACTVLPLPIQYEWRGNDGTVLGTTPTLTYVATALDGGAILNITARAYVDTNNKITRQFKVAVTNIDYGAHRSRYVSQAPATDRMVVAHSLGFSNGHVLLGTENDKLTASPGYIEEVDLSDPAHPALVGLTAGPNSPMITVAGGFVYVLGCDPTTYGPGQIAVYSASDIASGKTPFFTKNLGKCWGRASQVVVANGRALLPEGPQLYSMDVTDPNNPVLKGVVPGVTLMNGGIAYVPPYLFSVGQPVENSGSTGSDLYEWDLSDPSAPVARAPIHLTDETRYTTVYVYAGRLYALMNGPMAVFSLDAQGTLSALGTSFLPERPVFGTFVDSRMIAPAAPGLAVWDFSSAGNPLRLGDLDTQGWRAEALAVDGHTLVAAGGIASNTAPSVAGFDVFTLP